VADKPSEQGARRPLSIDAYLKCFGWNFSVSLMLPKSRTDTKLVSFCFFGTDRLLILGKPKYLNTPKNQTKKVDLNQMPTLLGWPTGKAFSTQENICYVILFQSLSKGNIT
jgi:lipopolysaccharide assembly outer membrane protein LptD (OstA)